MALGTINFGTMEQNRVGGKTVVQSTGATDPGDGSNPQFLCGWSDVYKRGDYYTITITGLLPGMTIKLAHNDYSGALKVIGNADASGKFVKTMTMGDADVKVGSFYDRWVATFPGFISDAPDPTWDVDVCNICGTVVAS